MSLDYEQLRPQVKKLGQQAVLRERRLQDLRQKARKSLVENAGRAAELLQKIDRVEPHYPALRCAIPGRDPLNERFSPGDPPQDARVLAVDGSQINPDIHGAVDYYLINLGGIFLQLNQDAPPQVLVDSQLKYAEDLYTEFGMVSAGQVALERDLAERIRLAKWTGDRVGSSRKGKPFITLTDGPLELWESKDPFGKRSSAFQQGLDAYLKSLEDLDQMGVITAGYVDRPRADLVVRLLEIGETADEDLDQGKPQRIFSGVSDADLFLPILGSGQRSAVFGIQSRTSSDYQGKLALHFFYINIGRKGKPDVARIEVPAWVAHDRKSLDVLHAVLLEQCRVVGGKGYPYVLHRAHEIAVVDRGDRELLTSMILKERLEQGLGPGEKSNKQFYKDLTGRKRYR